MARFLPLNVSDVRRETRDDVVVTLQPRPENGQTFDFQRVIESSIAYWMLRVETSFGAADSARFDTLKRFGLRHAPDGEL